MRCLYGLSVLMCLTGCQTTLDVRQAELIRTWGAANQSFADLIDVYRNRMNAIIPEVLASRSETIQTEFDLWLMAQSVGGGLVETDANDVPKTDADGKLLPMRVADLQKALDRRDSALMNIAADEVAWKQYDQVLLQAIDQFKRLNAVNLHDNDEIFAAKQSAQQFLESSLGALAGIAMGAATTP